MNIDEDKRKKIILIIVITIIIIVLITLGYIAYRMGVINDMPAGSYDVFEITTTKKPPQISDDDGENNNEVITIEPIDPIDTIEPVEPSDSVDSNNREELTNDERVEQQNSINAEANSSVQNNITNNVSTQNTGNNYENQDREEETITEEQKDNNENIDQDSESTKQEIIETTILTKEEENEKKEIIETTEWVLTEVEENEKKPLDEGVIVRDKYITWKSTNKLRIFENPLYNMKEIIAPQSTNTYQFVIRNNNNFNINYNMMMEETNLHNINMKYRLQKNNQYVVGNEKTWVTADELKLYNMELQKNSRDIYKLDWKWFESDNDTSVGLISAEYKLSIVIMAEQI